MKKLIKTIAMVLVIVMAANFASCATAGAGFGVQTARTAMGGGGSGGGGSGGGGGGAGGTNGLGSNHGSGGSGSVADSAEYTGPSAGTILGVALVVIVVYALVKSVSSLADAKYDSSTRIANGNLFSSDQFEQQPLMRTFYSLPETGTGSFIESVNAIPQVDGTLDLGTAYEAEFPTVWHLNSLYAK